MLASPSFEAPTLYHAHPSGCSGDWQGNGLQRREKTRDEDAALVPPDCIGKLLLAEEAQQLSDLICAAKARTGAGRALGLIPNAVAFGK